MKDITWTNFHPSNVEKSIEQERLVFFLDGEEKKQYNKWAKEHLENCEIARNPFSNKGGSISHNFVFTFQQGSAGNIIIVNCRCGVKAEFFDVDSW